MAPFLSLLCLMYDERKTGVLTFTRAGALIGRVVMRDGLAVSVEVTDATSTAATTLASVAKLPDGEFEFRAATSVDGPSVIHQPIQSTVSNF